MLRRFTQMIIHINSYLQNIINLNVYMYSIIFILGLRQTALFDKNNVDY